MSEKSPLEWALVAVAAAGIKAAEVAVDENPMAFDLPAFSVGDTLVYRDQYGDGTPAWATGDEVYDTLAEALAEAISREAYNRVEEALGQAGLAT